MTIKILIGSLVGVVLIIRACVYAHAAGYRKRALEDKKSLEDALVAQFRAEHAADVHRRRSLALLRALALVSAKKAKG